MTIKATCGFFRVISSFLTLALAVLFWPVLPANAVPDVDLPVFGTNQPPAQTFYIPIPEDNLLTALKAISTSGPADPMQTYVSLAVFVNGTVIYYDQWENGYDRDIANPNNLYAASNPGGTQIWGDGDPSNGFPPGYPNDRLSSGNVILLANAINSTTRKSVIDWDAGDKIGATKPIAVTRAGWASGSNTLLAGANEVFDTAFFGTEFQSPVGIDSPDSYQMFEYSALMIMASQDGTTVQVDKDKNGTFETTQTINEGETVFVNGGVKVGGRVIADKPVQVDLLTGDIGSNYESRFFRLLPTSTWTDALTTPVATATKVDKADCGTRVWLYNPNSSLITVRRISRTSSNSTTLTTNSIDVAANGNASYTLTEGCAVRFKSIGGKPFYALSTTDSTESSSNGSGNQAWDWGCALVPDDALTSQVLVGLGIGRDPTSSTSPKENGSPVWITPIGNGNTKARIYVDYDSDPTTGSATGVDYKGNKYDAYYDLRELVSQKIFNPGGDQTGMLIYTVDAGVKLAAAWGADPLNTSSGAPGLDFGTGIPPLPAFFMQKTSVLKTDSDGDGYITPNDVLHYDILIENIGRQPVTDIRVKDTLPSSVSYIAGSTVFTDENGATATLPDLAGANLFPLGTSDGYYFGTKFLPVRKVWHVSYDSQVGPFSAVSGVEDIQNNASVSSGTTTYTNSVIDALRGRVGDYVWLDQNMNGIQDPSEPGVNGIGVRLLNENGTPALNDFAVPYEFTTRTDEDGHAGFYLFTGVRPGRYYVEFTTPAGYVCTEGNLGQDAQKDSDVVGTNENRNATEAFRLDGGQFKLDVDAGLIKLGSISGSVLIDKNGNGIVDEEDSDPIFGVVVSLLDDEGTVVATTTTQPDGSYVFIGLLPGDYTVLKTNANGWTNSCNSAGNNDNRIDVPLAFGNQTFSHNFYDTMPVSIGDKVWVDTNRNGIQDVGEPGLPGVTVELLNTNGAVLASTTTDANGNYVFQGRQPGTYSVKFTPLSGYVFTTLHAGSDTARDSDAATNGSVAAFSLSYGTVNFNVDAGLFRLTAGVKIVKTAGNAANGATLTINGSSDIVYTYVVKNVGETYLSNIKVTDDKLGEFGTIAGPLAPNMTTTLTATATAVIADVVNVAIVDANPTDKDGNDLAGFANATATDDAKVVVIPYSSIGNRVWVDLNKNGLQDPDEPGLGGVLVTLYTNGVQVATTTTAANGSYTFENLLEGNYTVGFVTPYGYAVTTANAGNDDIDSDISPVTGQTSAFPLVGGANRTDIDAGYVCLNASIQIIKTAGNAADGTVLTFQGTNDVDYTYVVTNTGATYLSNITVTDDKLNAVGTVGLLAPGATATLWAKAEAVSSNVVNVGTVTAKPANETGTILVGFKDVTDTDDASVVVVPYSFIGDFVWNDLNTNGVQDAGEPGLAEFTVDLYTNNVKIASTITDANGAYGFNNLMAGYYSLKFIPPSAYWATTANTADDAIDSDIDENGDIASFTLGAGVIDRTRDAGFVRPVASVSIVKTAGNAADGATLTVNGATDIVYTYVVKNTGATHLSNIVVSDDKLGAIVTIDGPLAPNATTNITKTALAVSADVVNIGTVTAKPTNEAGDDLVGLAVVSATDDAKVVVIPYASIGNRVWVDVKRNGMQDEGEPGLTNVVVVLYTNGVEVATTTTDANGTYTFDKLLAGNYQIGFITPSGYRITAQDASGDALDSDIDPDTGLTAEFALDTGIEDDTRDAGFVLLQAGVEIVKTAGNAPDGMTLHITGFADVIYTYVVRNAGETYLSNIKVADDKLGTFETITGPLAPGTNVTFFATATHVSATVTNIATVTATPTDAAGVTLEALVDVLASDDAVVEVTPDIPTPDPTICELLDFGKTFNAIIFGDLDVNGGDTEGNLLVWGNASLLGGYSVGQAEYGASMPVAGPLHDALIVGGDLTIGPQGVNGNIVYGGSYSGYDRKYLPYAVRYVTPVTLDNNGNAPEDHSGMTRDVMLAQINALSTRLADMAERGVVSTDVSEAGDLTLTGNDPEQNIFDIDASQWSGSGTARTLVVPPASTVIINIRGGNVLITNGDMFLPAGMTPNQVLIHYVDAPNIAVTSFDHAGSVLAPHANATFVGASVHGIAIFGGNVTQSNGAEFHNFSMRIFACPINPSVRIVTTANNAPDGYLLRITSATDVVVRQTVINTGSAWLRSVALTAADNSVIALGDLAPGMVAIFETTFTGVAADAVYTAAVTAIPTTPEGATIPGFASVADSDNAAVAFNDGTPVTDPDDPGTIPGWTGKPDLDVTGIWFMVQPTITGEVFSVSVKVENTGEATSTGSAINLYLAGLEHSLTNAEANEVPTATFALGTFIPGEVKVFTFKNLTAQGVAGHYRAIALVDPANVIAESSEGNNHGSLHYSLTPICVTITVGTEGVTLTWNNDWGQIYTVMGSSNLADWVACPGFTNIVSACDEDPSSPSNTVTIPFSNDMNFFKLRVDQQ